MMSVLMNLAADRRAGRPSGIASVCSAHPVVIRAAVRNATMHGGSVLIEATCNQVNQFGGYTGMTPRDFVALVHGIAAENGLDPGKLILGGDHLGPNPWRNETAESAMAKARDMVAAYVEAGFRKLHLDTSMGCAGEPLALDDALTAERAASLAKVAECSAAASGGEAPVYIIGTEVPPPGGANHAIDSLAPTSSESAATTIALHRRIFCDSGLTAAFSRVIALVVQPGVEFGNANVIQYDRAKARTLSDVLDHSGSLVYEAHSTDYQDRVGLRELVEDGFAILKVGPELTFVLRETLYGLDLIAGELLVDYPPRNLRITMEDLMLTQPSHWASHYYGSDAEVRMQRHYSYSDRIRYYWNHPEAEASVTRLMAALDGCIVPAPLLRQYLPRFEEKAGRPFDPRATLVEAVESVLDKYRAACSPPGSALGAGNIIRGERDRSP